MNYDSEPRPLLKRPVVWVGTALVAVAAVLVAIVVMVPGESAENIGESGRQSTTPRLPLPPGATDEQGDVDDLGRPVIIPPERKGRALPQSEDPSPDSARNPLARPKGLQWQRVYGAPTPFSTSDGPRTIDSAGMPSGMSRTPQGAIISALQITSRMRYAPQKERYAIIDRFIAGATESDKQALREDGDILSITVDSPGLGDIAANMLLVPAAFRVRVGNFTADAATVDIAYGPHTETDPESGAESPMYKWLSLSTVWRDNEWKLRFKPALVSHEQEEGVMASLDSGEWATWVS